MTGLLERLHQYEPLFGAWYIRGEIGSGSFGRVYRVEKKDTYGNTFVSAVKAVEVFPTDSLQEEPEQLEQQMRSLYESEVLPMYALRGAANVVHIEDHAIIKIKKNGRVAGYDILIRMELVDSLSSLVREGELEQLHKDSVQIGLDLSRALIACAKLNYLHRDMNPGNVFRNQFGDYKLGDFGIAKHLSGTVRARTAIGTKLYVAPEVFHGAPYDVRADVYSLGLLLYQLNNNGYLPFFHKDLPHSEREKTNLRRLLGEKLPAPSQASEAFAAIILKACDPEPKNRYASAQELYDALIEYTRPVKIVETIVEKLPEPVFWYEDQSKDTRFDVLGVPIRPNKEILLLARQIAKPKEKTEPVKTEVGMLTKQRAAMIPAWRIRANWFRFNRLQLTDYSGIDANAFSGRKDLTAVNCGGTIEQIGAGCFAGCSSLVEFHAKSGLKIIEDNVFQGCVHLEKCSLPDSVERMGDSLFSGCQLLKEFHVPEQIEWIGDHFFHDCRMLQKVILPQRLSAIGTGAFRGCGLFRIQLPESCIRLGDYAFAGCRKLSLVQLSAHTLVLPKNCFSGCTALKQITLPEHLDTIEERAFYGCGKLESIVLPESVTWIGTHAFSHCDSLKQIYIPKSVVQIGEEIFGAGSLLRGKRNRLTVLAVKNSYAWDYCKRSGIRVQEPILRK